MSREDKFERTLLAYCVAGGAMVGVSQPSEATIVYSGPQNVSVGLGGSFDLDLDGNGAFDFRFYNEPDTHKMFDRPQGIVYAAIDSYGANRIAASPGTQKGFDPRFGWANALEAGNLIGPSLNFLAGGRQEHPGSGGKETDPSLVMATWEGETEVVGPGIPVKYHQETSGSWVGLTDRYLGLEFDIAGTKHFAWLRARVDSGYPMGFTLNDWAYDDIANKPIPAGALSDVEPEPVSEPPSLALLAFGAAAVLPFLRRRRQIRLEADPIRS